MGVRRNPYSIVSALSDLRLQLAADFLYVGCGQIPQELGRMRAFVFFGEREQIKRRHAEARGQTGNRVDRNGGEAVFDAGKVALRQCARVGESSEGQTLFTAEFTNAIANLESKFIGSGASRHGRVLFGLPFLAPTASFNGQWVFLIDSLTC
jgi:hypothetical protein